jgi:hypothetical protein
LHGGNIDAKSGSSSPLFVFFKVFLILFWGYVFLQMQYLLLSSALYSLMNMPHFWSTMKVLASRDLSRRELFGWAAFALLNSHPERNFQVS